MKKVLLLAVCFMIVSITASAVSINKALLDHNGTVTTYDDLQAAINASANGDIIYLTLGTFKGPFTINKAITIRGTGETSIIDGNVTVSISGTPEITNPIFEALTVSGSVTINSAMSNLMVRKCKITGGLGLDGTINGGKIERCQIGKMTFGGTVDNVYIDRCYITSTLSLSSTINGMTVVNTKLYDVIANSGATGNTTFVNCNIYSLFTSNFSGTIINSIIQSPANSQSGTYNLSSTVLLNTIINQCQYYGSFTIGSSSVTQNCYFVNSRNYVNSSCNSNPDSNYLGTDGTIVGIYGGSTPYSDEGMFTPSVPKVTSSSLDLDMKNKQLNVKLTVSPE